MSDFSQDQLEKRAEIQKSASIWGVVVGAILGLLALWVLSGQGSAIRFGGAVIVALIAGFLVFKTSFKSGAKSAECESCGATFSRSRSDRAETLAGSEPKEEREEQDDKSVKVTTWIEETYNVVDTYSCAKCGDSSTKAYTTKRRRDENTEIEPYVAQKEAASTGKSSSEEGHQADGGKSDGSKASSGGKKRSS